jgi:D-3-phosphoglycerate dehydrogenase / 2-oxoglutarate reductase
LLPNKKSARQVRMKVFISTSSFGRDDPAPLELLKQKKMEYTLNPYGRRLSEEEIRKILATGGYDGLLAGIEPLTKAVLSAAKSLKVISRVGVGLDNVDLAAAKKLKIKVFNTPGVLTDAVAELTLGLILAALRKIAWSDRKIRVGVWDKKMGGLLKNRTVGLVGFGNIGQRVAQLVRAFGAQVVFSDVCRIKATGARQVNFAELLRISDIISLHSSAAKCLIGQKEIDAMNPGVILVNTARGVLIDEQSLAHGLSSGKVSCAALDVFTAEPYSGKLLELDNVILTPHIGSYAREARIEMEKIAVRNLFKKSA